MSESMERKSLYLRKEIDMKYKVGDKVKIKTWEQMESEFGLDAFGTINCQYGFTKLMKRFCGTVQEIIDMDLGSYEMLSCDYVFSDDMIEGLAEEPVNNVSKTCGNCKYSDLLVSEEPCCTCNCDHNMFEAKNDVEPEVPAPDVVNHPSHYCQEGSMECIDEMVAVFGREAVMNFCLLNVWKYRKRAVFKNGEEDLKKSDWYMKKYIELKGDL
jgi:hypothetical protein